MIPTREAWRLLEPLHAVVYFSPEPLAALRAAGYRGYWMGYFAGRAAPLGPVGPEVVHALFYNFSRERVAKALPDAWSYGAPAAALAATRAGSVAALERLIGDADGVDRAGDLAVRVAEHAPMQGRALAAAHRAVPVPDDPLGRLWWAATVIREHRGDGHVAALLAGGIEGREAHVLHSLAVHNDPGIYETARDFDAAEWRERLACLEAKGLASEGRLNAAGLQVKQEIEDVTDRLSAEAFAALSAAELEELIALLRPLTSAVVRGGDLPLDAPMGLDLRELALD